MSERNSAEQPRVTTVADARWKASVEPYAEHSPMLDIPPGVVACQFCGNTRFRRSRIRIGDVSEFLMFRFPLRCMRCNQRQYGGLLTASFAVGSRAQDVRPSRGTNSWQSWTQQHHHAGRPTLRRPMTTAAGPRATQLKNNSVDSPAATPERRSTDRRRRAEDRTDA